MMYLITVKQIQQATGGCGFDNKNQNSQDKNKKDKPRLFSLGNLFKTAMTVDTICMEAKHLKRNSTGRFKTTSFK